MTYLNSTNIETYSHRFKVQLINSLSGFKSANLIATTNTQGQTNLAMFSSVVHLGADPALVGFIIRHHTTARHTLENIQQMRTYTINQVSGRFWQQAHQTSARYLQHECEFERTGLTVRYLQGISAPFVEESRLKYALSLNSIIPIPANNTHMVIGNITNIFCESVAIREDGYIDIEMLDTVAISGLDSYHVSTRLSRLSYAKRDKPVEILPLGGAPFSPVGGRN